MHQMTDEMKAEVSEERARQADPNMRATLAECLRSGNPKVRKAGENFKRGLLTVAEFEAMVREVLR